MKLKTITKLFISILIIVPAAIIINGFTMPQKNSVIVKPDDDDKPAEEVYKNIQVLKGMPSNDLHFDGFGYSNDAAAISGPHAGGGVNILSFTVSGLGLADVNDLLNPFGGPAGQGPVYFVADVYNTNSTGPGAGSTGLVAVTGSSVPVPEPGSLAIFGAALIGLGLVRHAAKAAALPIRFRLGGRR